MPDFKAFVRRNLSCLALPRQRELTIVEELAAQLEDVYDSLIARGLSETEAWNELQRQMPDWTTIGDELLEAEPVAVRLAQPEHGSLAGAMTTRSLARWLQPRLALGLAGDLQSSVRLLVKNRGFTLTTILTLAVCLGANAAIFTIVYTVLLRPFPIPDAHRIVAMGDVYPTVTPNDILSNTVPSYFDRQRAITALEAQAMFTRWYDTLTIDGLAQEIRGLRVTPSLFRVLHVSPALGRAFTDADSDIGAEEKIILSHGLWQRLYAGDRTVIGRDLRLGWTGRRYTIVGVLPQGFSFFAVAGDGHARAPDEEIQFWLPLAFTAAQKSDDARTRYGYFHIGRLRPGATIEQVQAQIDALNAANFERFPELGLEELGMYTAVTPLQDALTRGVRRTLYLLWGGAAFVLLIGALNIANLSLARATVRGREVATRLALGATRLRVIRHLMLEGVVLAGTGGLAGVAVGAWILRTLASSGMATLPNGASDQVDWSVAGATLVASVVVGVLIGLVHMTIVNRTNLTQVLSEGNRLGTGGRGTRVFRRGLVVTQVALSVVLLMGAGLLLTSFRNLLAVDAGFEAQRVTTATIFPPPSRYKDQHDVTALSNRLLESIRNTPGVEAAGITSNIALSGRTSPATVFAAEYVPQPGEALVLPSVVSVSPGYFEAMGTPLLQGRFFADSDEEHTRRVAIVDERLAARFWPNADPISKRLRRGGSEEYTVIGVVRDVRFESLAGQSETLGTAYFPHTQAPPLGRLRWIAVKAQGDSAAVVRTLRTALKAIDPDLPLSDIQTMTQRTSRSVAAQKLAMGLAGLFGIVALFLSGIGLYGVLAYVVAQKTREIGIRIALGCTPRGIFRMFFTEGVRLVAVGLVLGIVGTLAMARVLEGQVFAVQPTDPFVLTTVVIATGMVALLACVSPAYRATGVDPLNVLSEQ